MKTIKIVGTTLLTGALLVGCSANNTQNSNNQNNTENTKQQETKQNTQNNTTVTNVAGLDEQSALLGQIVKEFQNKYPDLAITTIELKSPEKPYNYHIEAVDNMKEYDFMYHTAQSHLMSHGEKVLEADEQNGVERQKEGIDVTTTQNVDNVIKTAVSQVANSSAVAWKLDKDNFVVYWEVKVNANGVVKEVKIDDATGKVIEVDND